MEDRANPDYCHDSSIRFSDAHSDENTSATTRSNKNSNWRKFIPKTSPDWFMVIFNGLLVIFTGCLWYATNGLWKDAHDQLDVMRGQLNVMQIDQRPWVQIIAEKINFLKIDDNGVSISFQLTMKNIGKTPATGIDLRIKPIVLTNKNFSEEVMIQQNTCSPANKVSPRRIAGISLMPNEDISEYISTSIDKKIIVNEIADQIAEEKRFNSFGRPENKATFLLIGCIDYILSSANDVHGQTFFIYDVAKRGKNNIPYMIKITSNTAMGPNSLIMEKGMQGNYAK